MKGYYKLIRPTFGSVWTGKKWSAEYPEGIKFKTEAAAIKAAKRLDVAGVIAEYNES